MKPSDCPQAESSLRVHEMNFGSPKILNFAACRPQGSLRSFLLPPSSWGEGELEAVCAGFDGRQVNWVLCKASKMQQVILSRTALLP